MVIAWLEAERDRCYAIVIAQLAYCVRRTAGSGTTLQAWLTRLVDALHGRIHGFNVSVGARLGRAGGTAREGGVIIIIGSTGHS